MSSSVVENYFLTSPRFKSARHQEKIPKETPWDYATRIVTSGSAPSDAEAINLRQRLTELLNEKYGEQKVDQALRRADKLLWHDSHAYKDWKGRSYDIYNVLTTAETMIVNPEWNNLDETPAIPLTFNHKERAGKYTQADTDKIESMRSEDLVSKHGLEGLFGGLHRRRKTNKSKRGGKKRKTTRKH
jgi:hypothetical protein